MSEAIILSKKTKTEPIDCRQKQKINVSKISPLTHADVQMEFSNSDGTRYSFHLNCREFYFSDFPGLNWLSFMNSSNNDIEIQYQII